MARIAAFVVAIALPAAASAATLDEGSGSRSAGELTVAKLAHDGVAVYCGGRTRNLVALTFDDGPSRYTQDVVSVLRRHRARATFFLVGERLGYWRGALRAETRVGAIGDHTWTHAWLRTLDARGLQEQIGRTRAAEIAHTGRRVQLFRPPYGARTPLADAYVRRLGMLQVLWDVADSEFGIRPGSIVLLHETRPETVPRLRRILKQLKERHLRPVTVPELLANDPAPVTRDARGLRTSCV